VTVTVEPHGDAVVVEVADQGRGFPDDAVPGTGLKLATRIVERAGGTLLLRRRAPAARVALLLPLSDQTSSTSNR
jgi:two-component sensor histidine kinase